MLELHAGSDAVLRLVALSTQVSVAGAGLLLLCILWLHWRRGVVERQRAAFTSAWRPHLAAIAIEGPGAQSMALPRLKSSQHVFFLREWIALEELLEREARGPLCAVAREVGLPRITRAMLASRRQNERLLAVVALGLLDDPTPWELLLAEARNPRLELSLAAARALVRLDPRRGIEAVIPLVLARDDWPKSRVAAVMQEAGAAALTAPLLAAIRAANPLGQARLIAFIGFTTEPEGSALIRELLEATTSDEVQSACLTEVEHPSELPGVRRLTRHSRWHIRMLAAKALGRFGERPDELLLVELLGDSQWWVRYRAAQALACLPWMKRDELRRIQSAQTDRYAADALEHAIAERSFQS